MFGIRKLVLGLSDGKRSFMMIEGLLSPDCEICTDQWNEHTMLLLQNHAINKHI